MTGEPQLTEEQLRAIEAEMDKITVEDVLLQTIVSLVNLAARKAALAGGEPAPEPDWPQVRMAIEGVRALLPLVEAQHGPALGQIREALAQLQMHYARSAPGGAAGALAGEPGAGEPAPAEPAQPEPPRPGEPGPAQRSGKLWVPGQ